MRPEDLREMSRRLEEIMFIAERGYVHTQAGALEESGRDERRVA